MQGLKISQSKSMNINFNARYKVSASSSNIGMFERHVIPLYRGFVGKPIRAFCSHGDLFVFTGKDDVEVFERKAPKSKTNFYNPVQYATNEAEAFLFDKNLKNYSFQILNNFRELINKLLITVQ